MPRPTTKTPRRTKGRIVLLDALDDFLRTLREGGYTREEVRRVQWAFNTGLNNLSSFETLLGSQRDTTTRDSRGEKH